jgi:hypothetical protein
MSRALKTLSLAAVLIAVSGALFAQPGPPPGPPGGPPTDFRSGPPPGPPLGPPGGPPPDFRAGPPPGFHCRAGRRPIICEMWDAPRPIGSRCYCDSPYRDQPALPGRVIP